MDGGGETVLAFNFCLGVDVAVGEISTISIGIASCSCCGNHGLNTLDERISQNTSKCSATELVTTAIHKLGGSLCRLHVIAVGVLSTDGVIFKAISY